MENSIPDRIIQRYKKMTKVEKKIANYVLDNVESLPLTSITELADRCSVADSTIFRFCKMLGYGGYYEFKLALAQEQSKAKSVQLNHSKISSTNDPLSPTEAIVATGLKLKHQYISAIEQTLELLNPDNVIKAAKLFHESQNIYCFGNGSSMVIAMEAWGRFINAEQQFITLQDFHFKLSCVSKMTERDTVWYFCYSGSTKEAIELLPLVKESGAKIVLVTRFKNSPIVQYADIILICGTNENPLQSGSVAAKIAQLTIIDMVYHEYSRFSKEQPDPSKKRITLSDAKAHL